MKFSKTRIEGLYIIEPELKIDERGYFARIFCKDEFSKLGLNSDITQVNRSFTKKRGTIRGMHFQVEPKAEDKIITCFKGVVYDVAVDLRKNSPTYGQWVAEELSEENKKMFYIPKGFAHGFQALTDDCELLYFMSEFYSAEYASGVHWDDPFFNINWPLKDPLVSDRDRNWPLIKYKK